MRFEDSGKLHRELLRQGFAPACKSQVGEADATIRVMSDISGEKGQFSDALSHIGIDAGLLPRSGDLRPLCVREKLAVAEPAPLDGLGDYDRLRSAMLRQLGAKEIELPLDILRTLPETLRQNGGEVFVWFVRERDCARIVDIRAERPERELGIAIDIGTTTVAMQLADLEAGTVMAAATRYNAQIERGMDVISRISYAKDRQRVEELRQLILSTVNDGLREIYEEHGVCADDIRNASIAGSTTMTELFLGVTPDYIRLAPYTPAVLETPLYRAAELGLAANPAALVRFAPNVGSYVGGDITSGLLCADFALDCDEVCLFIDIGTNGEIVLGNSEFLMGCACSAGPAFEGGGIEKGMRASEGAVERIDVNPETGECLYTVIGGGQPKGICGSGLISLAAQLFEAGIIDRRGKLDSSGKYAAVSGGRNARFAIVPAGDGCDGVYVTENDIDNLIRAKAAIFSACRVMLGSVGLDFGDIGKVYIAGGFGRYIDIDMAKTIGLLPNLPREKFMFIGNSSLAGAFMTLVSGRHREKERELASRITYVDLSNVPGYMDEYVSAMFLPHTDERLFAKRPGEEPSC